VSETAEVTKEMVRELIDKANMNDKDALERLIYIFGPESTIDTATTFLEHGGDLGEALVSDAGRAVERVVDTGADLFDSTVGAIDDFFSW